MSEDLWGMYLRAKEPGVREKAYAWKTAIGLQDVDHLRVSSFLVKTAIRHIKGEITMDQVREIAAVADSELATQKPQIRQLLVSDVPDAMP